MAAQESPVDQPGPVGGGRLGDWPGLAARVLLLLVLAVGASTVVGSRQPAERSDSDLVADLDAGRVTYLERAHNDSRVVWVAGWWRWRTATLTSWQQAEEQSSAANSQEALQQWLYQQIDASGHPIAVSEVTDPEPRWWPVMVTWEPLRTVTMAAWLGVFLMMLGRQRHRYANRWAWFWMFLFGPAGVLLYLIVEPQPIWRPRSWPRSEGAPAGGGVGFLWGVLLSIAVELVVAGVKAI